MSRCPPPAVPRGAGGSRLHPRPPSLLLPRRELASLSPFLLPRPQEDRKCTGASPSLPEGLTVGLPEDQRGRDAVSPGPLRPHAGEGHCVDVTQMSWPQRLCPPRCGHPGLPGAWWRSEAPSSTGSSLIQAQGSGEHRLSPEPPGVPGSRRPQAPGLHTLTTHPLCSPFVLLQETVTDGILSFTQGEFLVTAMTDDHKLRALKPHRLLSPRLEVRSPSAKAWGRLIPIKQGFLWVLLPPRAASAQCGRPASPGPGLPAPGRVPGSWGSTEHGSGGSSLRWLCMTRSWEAQGSGSAPALPRALVTVV